MAKIIGLNGINDQIIDIITEHFQPRIKIFNRNEIVVRPSQESDMMGIVLNGRAYLATINRDYQKRIMDYYEAKDIFCNQILTDLDSDSYYICAKTKCTVAFIDYKDLLQDNSETIVKLREDLIFDSGRRLLEHINILSQRTLRNKLISFFEYCRKRRGTDSFTLPMSLSELADYLAVDRSAMMREIGKMKEEKIVKADGRNIILKK